MVDHRVRPARTAVMLPSSDPGWMHAATSVLGSLSLTWGGLGDIVVPVTDREPHPAFRRVVRAFDPDWVTYYEPTWYDLAQSDPDSYNAQLDTWVHGLAEKGADPSGLRNQLEDQLRDEPRGWAPSTAAVGALFQWCAPHGEGSPNMLGALQRGRGASTVRAHPVR